MKHKSKAYTYFSISSKEFDVINFSDTFQIIPTLVWETRHGEKCFEYRIDAKDALEGLDEALEELRLVFSPKSSEIKEYALQNDLYIKIFVVIESEKKETNGVLLDREFIEFLNNIGAEMEIDIYP